MKTMPLRRRLQAVWLILTATPVVVTIEMLGYEDAPEEITDEMVDAGARAFAVALHKDSADQQDADYYAEPFRAAMTAADVVRRRGQP